jgi:hypothetical protein
MGLQEMKHQQQQEASQVETLSSSQKKSSDKAATPDSKCCNNVSSDQDNGELTIKGSTFLHVRLKKTESLDVLLNSIGQKKKEVEHFLRIFLIKNYQKDLVSYHSSYQSRLGWWIEYANDDSWLV